MAWLEMSSSGIYQIAFRFHGEKFKMSTRTRDAREAEARLHRVEEMSIAAWARTTFAEWLVLQLRNQWLVDARNSVTEFAQ